MIKVKLFKNQFVNNWQYISSYADHMFKRGIKYVNNISEADLLIFSMGGGKTFSKIPLLKKRIITDSKIPVILVERLDSSIVWFRHFRSIPNLKAVFKNRLVRPEDLNNSRLLNGRFHYKEIYKSIINNENSMVQAISMGYMSSNPKYYKLKYRNKISKNDLDKIKLVPWDWNNSFIGRRCEYMRDTEV